MVLEAGKDLLELLRTKVSATGLDALANGIFKLDAEFNSRDNLVGFASVKFIGKLFFSLDPPAAIPRCHPIEGVKE